MPVTYGLTTMSSTASTRCGFTTDAIAMRLRLLELEAPASEALGERLQAAVIRPNIDAIVDRFCDYLGRIEQFNSIVAQHSDLQDCNVRSAATC